MTACGAAGLPAGEPVPEPNLSSEVAAKVESAPTPPPEQALNLFFVHGVESDARSRARADQDLADLERYLQSALPSRTSPYERVNGVKLVIRSARANLYAGPDGQLLSPSIDSLSDGSGQATATRWREQLVAQLNTAFPHGERNIVLVGHSTGARVAMEVTADVGSEGAPGSHSWGVQERIAGVVSLHGMIDRLQSPEYDFLGPLDFLTGCRLAQEAGWCDYAAQVSAVSSADWVAIHKYALMLTSWGNCGISLWTGQSDKTLPLRAQASPAAPGLGLSPLVDGSWGAAHGTVYGPFCHSDLTDPASPRHSQAVAAAGEQILDFLFKASRRVANASSAERVYELPNQPSGLFSLPLPLSGGCTPGVSADPVKPTVVGVCRHSNLFDGDDHPFDAANVLEVGADPGCGGSLRWEHLHQGEFHSARAWSKSHATTPGLLSTMR